jgi:hypothetical protein
VDRLEEVLVEERSNFDGELLQERPRSKPGGFAATSPSG